MIATYLGPAKGTFTGDARWYRLDPPLQDKAWDGNADAYRDVAYPYVVVSATTVMGEPETYVFPATEDSKVKDWVELAGSYKGGLDHAQALAYAGYEVVVPEEEE